jgi:hypothetical protein
MGWLTIWNAALETTGHPDGGGTAAAFIEVQKAYEWLKIEGAASPL